jgi:hypothetical protein
MTDTTPNKRNDLTRSDTLNKADATTSSDKSSKLISSVATSPLFKLSPELRNKIYRLVLVRDPWDDFTNWEVIVDKANGIPEPALLASNKIIRSEASGIFYHENCFSCRVLDFDPTPILLLQSKFKEPLRKNPPDIELVRSRTKGELIWENLVSWLHMCHRGECIGLLPFEDDDFGPGMGHGPERRILEGLFSVAANCPGLSSAALDCVIESMHMALVEDDYAWRRRLKWSICI